MSMVECARGHDIGLALEVPSVANKQICTSNKGFIYMLAGLAILFSDTEGSESSKGIRVGSQYCHVTDLSGIAQAFKIWSQDKNLLAKAKQASWEAAAVAGIGNTPKNAGCFQNSSPLNPLAIIEYNVARVIADGSLHSSAARKLWRTSKESLMIWARSRAKGASGHALGCPRVTNPRAALDVWQGRGMDSVE